MDVRPWDNYAVGTKEWIDAHKVTGRNGETWWAVSKADQRGLWADRDWRAGYLTAKHKIIEMTSRTKDRAERMRGEE